MFINKESEKMEKVIVYEDPASGKLFFLSLLEEGRPHHSTWQAAGDGPVIEHKQPYTDEAYFDFAVKTMIPVGVTHQIIKPQALPDDRRFMNAWVFNNQEVVVDLEKAKATAHSIRRRLRTKAFAPHDKIISLSIPGPSSQEAESAREVIRLQYKKMQEQIDLAEDFEEIKRVLAP